MILACFPAGGVQADKCTLAAARAVVGFVVGLDTVDHYISASNRHYLGSFQFTASLVFVVHHNLGDYAHHLRNYAVVLPVGKCAAKVLKAQWIVLDADAPTLKECGYDVTCISCRGLVCSPEVPDEIVSILEQTVLECVESDEFTEFMNSMYSVAMPMDSAEYTALLEEENTTFPPLVEAAGLSSN